MSQLHLSLAVVIILYHLSSVHSAQSSNDGDRVIYHPSPRVRVVPEQSTRFAKLYRKAGGKAELIFIEHAHHAFWNYRPWFDNAMERAAAFFLRVTNHE
jgi:hypothetical protein